MNGTTVPTGRDNTYNSDEIHRKDSEELFDTSFNDDQKQVLNNISTGGGPSLPEVTADDNGMVLTVVEGVWDKAAGGGSTGIYKVHFDITYDPETFLPILTPDKTFEEVCEAYEAGSLIFFEAGNICTQAFPEFDSSGITLFTAEKAYYDASNINVAIVEFPLIGSPQVVEYQYDMVPSS